MEENLPSPSFDYTPEDSKFIAGIRPYRLKTYRLEGERMNEKLIIHNYGHGGAGITLSWGCALEVEDLVVQKSDSTNKEDIAIIGCGVMGLTAATRLLQLGHKVTIYAKEIPPNTTSNIAGGQWNPSSVAFKEENRQQFNRILRRSFRMFESQIRDDYGVSRRTNYTRDNKGSFELVPKDIIPEPQYYKRVPFDGHDNEGYAYETLLVEPPIFLNKLLNDLRKGGVSIVKKKFVEVEEVKALSENIVINSTGYGAKKLWKDEDVIPIKGQLALLKAQELPYLYSGYGYIFPRKDYVVLGGTYERGNEDTTPDEATCKGIIEWHKGNFDPKQLRELTDLKELYKTDRIL